MTKTCPMEMPCLEGAPTCDACRRGTPDDPTPSGVNCAAHGSDLKGPRGGCLFCERDASRRRTADAQPWVPAYAVTGELPPEPRSASAPHATCVDFRCDECRRASAATTYEHCKGCLNEADCVARGCKMLHDEPRTSNAITEAWKKGHDAAMAVSRDDVVATWKTRALMAEAELERLDSGSASNAEKEFRAGWNAAFEAFGGEGPRNVEGAWSSRCASKGPGKWPGGYVDLSDPKASPARSSAYWGIAQSFLRSRYGKMVQEEDIDALEAVVASAARATVEECAEYLEGIHDDMSKTENARTLAPHFAHSLRAHVAGLSSCEERGSK